MVDGFGTPGADTRVNANRSAASGYVLQGRRSGRKVVAMSEKTNMSRRTFIAGSTAAAGVAAVAMSGCSSNEQPAGSADAGEKKATLAFTNAHVQTMVAEDDIAEAVVVSGNEIVYVGDTAGAQEFITDDTEVIDLEGAFLAPGFIDSHIHAPGSWCDTLFAIGLYDYTTNEEYLAAIKKFVDEHPDNEAYWGGPFMLNAYMREDGSNPGPMAADLDAICADKPIMITDISNHACWVNSCAMALAGWTKDTPNPEGGAIYRDEEGNPTGFLADTAYFAVANQIDTSYTDEQLVEALREFMKEANSYGVTGLCNMGQSVPDKSHNELYHELDEKGELTLRVTNSITIQPGNDFDDVLKNIKESKELESDMLHTQLAKIFYDGVTEAATAVMLEPYVAEAGKGDNWYGEPIWPEDEFKAMVAGFDKEGLQIHIHAIGDGAVRNTITAYEEALAANGDRDHRHTITHVCAITDEDIERMAKNKIIASLQFLWMYGDPLYELEKAFIGEERAQAMYPVKRMAEAGVIISGASDNPVTPFVVTDELEIGVTRNSPFEGEETTDMTRWPEQALTPYQMLECYTKNSAYQNFTEDMVGTVEVGKKADLVVMDKNLLEIDPMKINEAKVLYTVSDGRVVYKG